MLLSVCCVLVVSTMHSTGMCRACLFTRVRRFKMEAFCLVPLQLEVKDLQDTIQYMYQQKKYKRVRGRTSRWSLCRKYAADVKSLTPLLGFPFVTSPSHRWFSTSRRASLGRWWKICPTTSTVSWALGWPRVGRKRWESRGDQCESSTTWPGPFLRTRYSSLPPSLDASEKINNQKPQLHQETPGFAGCAFFFFGQFVTLFCWPVLCERCSASCDNPNTTWSSAGV